MPARDRYHDLVVKALVADGWEITDDPLTLSYGGRDLYVDLGAANGAIGAVQLSLLVFDEHRERIDRWIP